MSIDDGKAVPPRSGTAALEKGLAVLDHIAKAQTPMRFSDLLITTGLPKATLHRILQALVSRRLLSLDQMTHTYQPGLWALELAQRAWEEMDIRKAAASEIVRLAEETAETVHLAVLDIPDVVYIDKVESQQRIRMFSSIGKRGPAYCTGVGKAILAFLTPEDLREVLDQITYEAYTKNTIVDETSLLSQLEEIRDRGYSLDLEEHELGILCVAAPVFDHRGLVAAAVSVTGPSFRFTKKRLGLAAPIVLSAARRITAAIGGRVTSYPAVSTPVPKI